MGSAINNTLLFLVQTLFNIYMIILFMRILLEAVQANAHNPIVQFLLTVTTPIIKPISRYIPHYNNINSAAIIVLFVISMIKLGIIVWLRAYIFANPLGLVIWTCGELINLLINIYFYAILLYAILSWVAPHLHNPATELIVRLTTPILKPFQRVIPPIANIDISPLVAIVCLQAFAILLVQFITSYGALLSFGKALA